MVDRFTMYLYTCRSHFVNLLVLLRWRNSWTQKKWSFLKYSYVILNLIHQTARYWMKFSIHAVQPTKVYIYIIILIAIRMWTGFTDQTHMEMRGCIVNIIAIVFGSPSRSNHLWYHLMEPKTLEGTFLTGFMVGTQCNILMNHNLYTPSVRSLEVLMVILRILRC